MTPARKLLVVEDEDNCASILEVALDGLRGLRVARVGTAEAGLDLLRSDSVALVVTDVELPGMSGLELLAAAAHLPVVVISATTDPEAEGKALGAGASAFFAKPFSPAAIRRKVEELLKE